MIDEINSFAAWNNSGMLHNFAYFYIKKEPE